MGLGSKSGLHVCSASTLFSKPCLRTLVILLYTWLSALLYQKFLHEETHTERSEEEEGIRNKAFLTTVRCFECIIDWVMISFPSAELMFVGIVFGLF